MGYVKPTETTKQFLTQAPLPTHGKTYTVIPHKDVMSHTQSLLTQNGFTIERELFRANMNAQVAQGIYHIKPIAQVFNMYSQEVKEEEDLGMMFAWTNSYDKSTKFQCAIGGYVMCCDNGIVSGDMATFARKHTGDADTEVNAQIASQIKHAHKFFKRLVDDKNNLRTITLSVKEQSELLGRLFFDNKLLDATQMSCIKSEMDEPSYEYKADQDNAWAFYNHVTHALKKCHPRTWLSDQQKFHDFIAADVLGKMGITPIDNTPDPDIQEDTIIEEPVQAAVIETLDIDETVSEPLDAEGEGENQHANTVHTKVLLEDEEPVKEESQSEEVNDTVDNTDSELSTPKEDEIDWNESDEGSFSM